MNTCVKTENFLSYAWPCNLIHKIGMIIEPILWGSHEAWMNLCIKIFQKLLGLQCYFSVSYKIDVTINIFQSSCKVKRW